MGVTDDLRLRTALRDLVALSAVPAAWVGRDPPAIAAELTDVLVRSLYLDFAFVRLCDPNGGAAVEIVRGSAWPAFPEWLRQYLSVNGRLSRREIVRGIGDGAQGGAALSFPSASMPRAAWLQRRAIAPIFPAKSTSCCSPSPPIMLPPHFGWRALSMIIAAPRKRCARANNSFARRATNSRPR